MTQTAATEQGPRAQALADGALVAANPALAAEAGWRYPVAYTSAVHTAAVAWSEAIDQAKGVESYEGQAGREWDVLHAAINAVRHTGPGRDRLTFTVHAVPPTGKSTWKVGTALVVHIGPGDTPELVVTIMLPGED